MDERLRFVARLLEGEKMAPLCAEFGISRKTGYKVFDRYKDCGVQAFSDRSHRAHRQANRLPAPIEATIVRLKREYPGGARPRFAKNFVSSSPAHTCQRSVRSMPCWIAITWCAIGAGGATCRGDHALTADPTECAVVCRLQRRISPRQSQVLLSADDHRLRQSLPLDVRGAAHDAGKFAFTVFERTFKEFGLPQVIRTDNGVPFASAHAIYGLSKLAVWWLRLGDSD